MNTKKLLLDRVIQFYEYSHDFNGIPFWRLIKDLNINKQDATTIIGDLIREKKVTLNFTLNPHIKQFEDFPIDKQLEVLNDMGENTICVYPTEEILAEHIDPDKHKDKPFTRMLLLGKPQLEPIFFEIEVLENYFVDPRYIIFHSDYSGTISYHSDSNMNERDQVLLETFGIGYDENDERVVAVYLRYLSDLTPEHQQRWQTYQVNRKCKIAYAYYQNTVLGEWADEVSIYEAFIEELYHINNMSEKMFGKKLFKKDFKDGRPEHFRTIFRPTLDNYYSFIHVLDKMMSENISKDFFDGVIRLEEETERDDGKIIIRAKGTISLLEEWLRKSVRIQNEEDFDLIFKPFKNIRKLRQKPAHAINKNLYSKEFYKEQNKLIHDCYTAVRMIRLLFANHPAVVGYKVPDWLFEGKITIY
ncbi:hypothetical protein [Brevibacillus borstelensis]|uniref:hypothetical protein n=1 Tax=Brevibacillus borstelensis TaxID=45462 RepID=UPI00287FE05B|nr:hypothetical protein [Brevibacillus borstelensis]MED1875488.1 hypothetical protein [Brevibacillus borstelensis]WNF04328.1 hypothetical protein RFB14_18215 [Brevibacillus borstelensis]